TAIPDKQTTDRIIGESSANVRDPSYKKRSPASEPVDCSASLRPGPGRARHAAKRPPSCSEKRPVACADRTWRDDLAPPGRLRHWRARRRDVRRVGKEVGYPAQICARSQEHCSGPAERAGKKPLQAEASFQPRL